MRERMSFKRGRTKRHDKAASTTTARLSGSKLWCFRLMALVGGPLIFCAVLEMSLRLFGYGHPTGFLLPVSQHGRKILTQNNQFGWRFFGPQMSRLPEPLAFSQTRDPAAVRLFVFGESAAAGEPQPEFGPARMLQAIMSLRYPGVKFEVMNAAMTAISSHAVREIARDCAEVNADIWVIYMGNNEVVGPFGAGTVFGSSTLPLPLIRFVLALKATRTGQLLGTVLNRKGKSPGETDEWGGMAMFAGQQVPADDARMRGVYHHFERNLADIVEAGRRKAAGVVVSTVAVNLRDCSPFGSAHRSDLSQADKETWDGLWRTGVQAQNTGETQEALESFERAAAIDDTFAELSFRQAQCALALGRVEVAQQYYKRARDLDTLRFRCDSRINEIIRHAASNRERERILLVDSEQVFAKHSPNELPGQELFYEHVHLTFDGNYLLARSLAAQVERLLPERIRARVTENQSWPTRADCARRLGWSDWNQLKALYAITARLSQAPFTGQFDHEARARRCQATLETLAPATYPAGVSNALVVCENALAAQPDDGLLHAQMASLKNAAGDLAGAVASARREVDLLPNGPAGWQRLGAFLLRQQQFGDASPAFRRAFELNSQDVTSLQNLAQSLAALGRHEEAIREYRHAVAIKPHFGLAWMGLGGLLEKLGRQTEAEDCYQRALSNNIRRLQDLRELADFFYRRKSVDAAAYYYKEAIQLNPLDAILHIGAAESLGTLGRTEEAARHAEEAVRLAPALSRACLVYGVILGQQGRISEASEQLRQALRLEPEMLDAQLNLAVALAKQGNFDEASTLLQAVLQRSPTNEMARRYNQLLSSRASAVPGETK